MADDRELTAPADPVAEGVPRLPVEPHEGIAPVAIVGERAAARLVTGALRGTILRIALPAVASSLLMTIFFSADAFWIGTRIGSAALAAASVSLFYIWMLVALAEMIGVGLTAVAARRYGEGRTAEATRVAGDSVVFAVLLGALVSIVAWSLLPTLFAIMHTPPDVTALGIRYLGAYLWGMPLLYGFFALDAAFRAAGDTRTPLLLLLVSVGFSLALDPVLILGLLGFPEMGIAGAAVATGTTRGASFAIGCVIAARRGLITLGPVRPASILAVCRIGAPTAVTGIVFSLIYVAITRTATQFGTPALAALGIGHRVESWLFMIGAGFGAATAAIVGQNIGAGRIDRAERAGWLAVGYCTILGAVAFVLEVWTPESFASLFTDDPAVIAEAARYLRIAAIAQLAVCAEVVLDGALGGAGETVPPMVWSAAFTLSRIPLAFWAADRWGTSGIWWVLTITAVARALALMYLWGRGRWKLRSV